MKSARSDVSALSMFMKLLYQAIPGFAFAAVPGVPILIAALLNDGHSEIAVATGMFDWLLLSGSLKPSTNPNPLFTNDVIEFAMPVAVCSFPVWPQIIGTNWPPWPLPHGSDSVCVQL